MKVQKPNTDCAVELKVLANGQRCPEFVLPDAEDEPSAAVCYIPIADNDTITVQGTFSGSVLYGRIDVLADGSFVANRMIEVEASKEGILTQFDKRKVDFQTFLHVPDTNNRKNPRLRPRVVEGRLLAKPLPAAAQTSQLDGGEEAMGIGVGSLTLIVSLNQQSFETYGEEDKPAYSSCSLGSWRESVPDVKASGIKPEHELGMEVFPDRDPVTDKRATLFWRDLNAQRPGDNAWAYFIFYYRTQAAIDAAGCVPQTEAKMLPPDSGTFTKAGKQKVVPPQNVDPPAPPPAPAAKAAPIAPNPPPAPAPKKTLGGTLYLHSGPSILHTPSVPPTENDESTVKMKPKESAKSKTGGMMSPTQPTQSPRSSPAAQPRISAGSRSAFSSSLFPTSSKNTQSTMSSSANTSAEQAVDDLAAPSVLRQKRPAMTPIPKKAATSPVPPPAPTQPSPTTSAQTKLATQIPTNKQSALQATKDSSEYTPSPAATSPVKATTQTPSRKRTISEVAKDSTENTPSPTASNHSAVKRARNEELRVRTAQLKAEIQEKLDRAAAAKVKSEEAQRQRDEQQQQWAAEEEERKRVAAEEEERKRVAAEEEEERKRAAQEEEQERLEEAAMEAEMEALEREALAADEAVAKLEKDEENARRDWEEAMRARGAPF